jgi:hypothetical protein
MSVIGDLFDSPWKIQIIASADLRDVPGRGLANPSPDPFTMLILGGACAVLVEAAEFMVWSHDRRPGN